MAETEPVNISAKGEGEFANEKCVFEGIQEQITGGLGLILKADREEEVKGRQHDEERG